MLSTCETKLLHVPWENKSIVVINLSLVSQKIHNITRWETKNYYTQTEFNATELSHSAGFNL